MDILHFTPGSLDTDGARRHGAVAHMPLASGGVASKGSADDRGVLANFPVSRK